MIFIINLKKYNKSKELGYKLLYFCNLKNIKQKIKDREDFNFYTENNLFTNKTNLLKKIMEIR